MPRPNRRLLLGALAVLAVMFVGLAIVFHVPQFYRETLPVAGSVTEQSTAAAGFLRKTVQIANRIDQGDAWSEAISQDEANSWFANDLPIKHPEWLPGGVGDVRLRFHDGAIQLGFSASYGPLRVVCSGCLRPKLTGENEFAVEVQDFRLGAIPLPAESILAPLIERLEAMGWNATWGEFNGRDVCMLRLPEDSDRQRVLETLLVDDGVLRIAGREQPIANVDREQAEVR